MRLFTLGHRADFATATRWHPRAHDQRNRREPNRRRDKAPFSTATIEGRNWTSSNNDRCARISGICRPAPGRDAQLEATSRSQTSFHELHLERLMREEIERRANNFRRTDRISLRLVKAALRIWELKQPDQARVSWLAIRQRAKQESKTKARNRENECMKSSPG